ncbi:histidinol-phosphatase [Salmonella enterica subsp. enterica serovar Choleraesuis]|nr:histidinol-phosphatase [Salmonella enterica subsp. enterica serovar Choleraesuis]
MSVTLPDVNFLHKLADAASQQTLPRFRALEADSVQSKPKEGYRFDPVTDADREAERVMRALIEEEYPQHAILGEEFGASGSGDWRWVLDPVDGTRPFICGLPVWGTLIGLTHRERAVMGMMSQPFTQERFWADGNAAWYRGPSGEKRLHTRQNMPLEGAILHTTGPELIAAHPEIRFSALNDQVLMTRYGGECYAMAMLAAGQIDLCLEFALQPYDIVALIPIIEQAGGRVTTVTGGRPENGGAVLASANFALHEQALDILNS